MCSIFCERRGKAASEQSKWAGAEEEKKTKKKKKKKKKRKRKRKRKRKKRKKKRKKKREKTRARGALDVEKVNAKNTKKTHPKLHMSIAELYRSTLPRQTSGAR